MTDRSLNYGRRHIGHLLTLSGEFRTVLDMGANQGATETNFYVDKTEG